MREAYINFLVNASVWAEVEINDVVYTDLREYYSLKSDEELEALCQCYGKKFDFDIC